MWLATLRMPQIATRRVCEPVNYNGKEEQDPLLSLSRLGIASNSTLGAAAVGHPMVMSHVDRVVGDDELVVIMMMVVPNDFALDLIGLHLVRLGLIRLGDLHLVRLGLVRLDDLNLIRFGLIRLGESSLDPAPVGLVAGAKRASPDPASSDQELHSWKCQSWPRRTRSPTREENAWFILHFGNNSSGNQDSHTPRLLVPISPTVIRRFSVFH